MDAELIDEELDCVGSWTDEAETSEMPHLFAVGIVETTVDITEVSLVSLVGLRRACRELGNGLNEIYFLAEELRLGYCS